MSSIYGLNKIKLPGKSVSDSPADISGLKTQKIYKTLCQKRETKPNKFETFLKSKLKNSGIGATSARTHKQLTAQNAQLSQSPFRLSSESPDLLSTQVNSPEIFNSIPISRTQRSQNSSGLRKKNMTPRGVEMYFVKSARGNKAPIRLTESFVKMRKMVSLKAAEHSIEQNKVDAEQKRKECNKSSMVSERSPTLRGYGKNIGMQESSVEEGQGWKLDRQSLKRVQTELDAPLVTEGSVTERRSIRRPIRINIPTQVYDNGSIEEKSLSSMRVEQDAVGVSSRMGNSSAKFLRKTPIHGKGGKGDNKAFMRSNSSAKLNSTRFSFLGHSMNRKLTEESLIERPKSIISREYETTANGTPVTDISQLSPVKKKREVNKMQITSYIPEWLTGRNDFAKAIENKEGNLRNFMIMTCNKLPSDRTSEEIEIVVRWLRKVTLFKNLADELLESIASNVHYRLYNKDEPLCLQGEIGDCLYIIYEGLVKCLVNGNEIAQFKPYDTPGQKALESSAPRTASLIAVVPTIVLRLERESYCTIMEYYIRNKRIEHLDLIDKVEVLKEFKESKKEVIISCLQSQQYAAGDVIYNEGEPAETFYILKSGKLQIEAYIDVEKENFWPKDRIWRERTKVTRNMKFKHTINPTEYFGEVELIERSSVRINSVVCLENCNILLMNKRDFNDLFDYEDLKKFKIASEKHLLQDIDLMRSKLEKKEEEKRKVKNVMVSALKHHLAGLAQTQPKGQMLIESSIDKFKREYKQYMQENTIGKTSRKFDIVAIKYKE